MAPVVQRLDNTIHWINRYLTNSTVCFAITYLLYSHLSVGVVLTTLCTTGPIQQNLVSLEQPIGNFTVHVGPNPFLQKLNSPKKVTTAYALISTNTHREKVKGSQHVAIPVPISPRWGRGGGMATQRLGKGEH